MEVGDIMLVSNQRRLCGRCVRLSLRRPFIKEGGTLGCERN